MRQEVEMRVPDLVKIITSLPFSGHRPSSFFSPLSVNAPNRRLTRAESKAIFYATVEGVKDAPKIVLLHYELLLGVDKLAIPLLSIILVYSWLYKSSDTAQRPAHQHLVNLKSKDLSIPFPSDTLQPARRSPSSLWMMSSTRMLRLSISRSHPYITP